MIENKPSNNLWALSSLASTIGSGDFATHDFDSFRRQEFVFAALNLLLIGALFALQAVSRFVRARPARKSAELTAEQVAEMIPDTHNLWDFLASLEKR